MLACENLTYLLADQAGRQHALNFVLPRETPERPHHAAVIVGNDSARLSALLQVLALWQRPLAGRISWQGQPIFSAEANTPRRWQEWRQRIGVAASCAGLLPTASVLANLQLPLQLAGAATKQARQHAAELLEWLGLSEIAAQPAASLHAHAARVLLVARACIHRPRLLLLEEPLQLLTPELSRKLWHLVTALQAQGTATLVFTQSRGWAKQLAWPTYELSPQGLQPHHPAQPATSNPRNLTTIVRQSAS